MMCYKGFCDMKFTIDVNLCLGKCHHCMCCVLPNCSQTWKFSLPSGSLMASLEIKSGTLVSLQDLHPSLPFFKQGASLRVTGK